MHEDFSKSRSQPNARPRRPRWLRVAALSIGFFAMGTGLSACYVAPYPYRPYYAAPVYYHPGYYGGYYYR